MPTIVHLTASRSLGGAERQMLGLARAMPPRFRSYFLSFAEGGLCRDFLHEARLCGFQAESLRHDFPRLARATYELTTRLRQVGPAILCCHGYKANLLWWFAARKLHIPVIAISHGWTGESLRVRLYECLDKLALRFMDAVVAVSACQAQAVFKAGVRPDRLVTIRNAVGPISCQGSKHALRRELQLWFGRPVTHIVLAAGRLSPEKGFSILVRAATHVLGQQPSTGFILFGDGVLRPELSRQIAAEGLADRFILAGHHPDLRRFLPCADVFVLPSYTEGLPCVVLEAQSAGVPVVATAVGGTPEAVHDEVTGYLVPSGEPASLAARVLDLLASEEARIAMGNRGQELVTREFTFAANSMAFQRLIASLCGDGIAPSETAVPLGAAT